MESYLVTGGQPLEGEVTVSGAKNVALKVLIAGLLTDEEVKIENVPLISDLFALAEIIKELGGKVEIFSSHTMVINASTLHSSSVTNLSFGKLRASFLLLIPLLVRFRQAKIPLSGGDKIGVRPIDRTINGLTKMGIELDYGDGYYGASVKKITSTHYKFAKNTHTGTEALIMMSALTPGKTVLENAAQEPEVDDLIKFLNSMGAKIKRTKARTIEITGVVKLHGTHFKIMSDRNEVVTFALAAILTKGKISIKAVVHSHLRTFYQSLKNSGIKIKTSKDVLLIDGTVRPIFSSQIATSFYPGFMTDWQAPWVLLMTQAEGVSQMHEKVFENRFGYVRELVKMGAKIVPVEINSQDYNFNQQDDNQDNFHAVEIVGPTKLQGQDLIIPDLRAGATLVLAALTAGGRSRLYGIEHIDRGYENFSQRLKLLGAKIERVSGI